MPIDLREQLEEDPMSEVRPFSADIRMVGWGVWPLGGILVRGSDPQQESNQEFVLLP